MDKFDEKVIGYESTKEILRQILDILKRPEVYKRKGISIPRGLLMESDPGLGKSLLASILMEESERKPFVFRKTSQENSFLDELRAVFAMAKEDAPSILLLEDLNLYVESTSPYAPEWACLQACIDDAKDTDLFVIATTNDTRYMPPSLLRPGRFDYVIYLQPPIGENAENIVSYYLRDKDLAEDVLISDIVKAIGSHKIRNGSARFVIGGVLAIQRSVVPVGISVNISPPIIGQLQRLCKDDGAPVVDHHEGCDLAGNAPALIIVPDIVSVQAVRDGISPDADAGEQCRLSANRDFFVTFGHCIKGHKAFLLKFQ